MRASVALGCWLVIAVAATWAQTTAPQLVVLGRNVACRAAPALSGAVVVRLDVADLVDQAATESEPPDWVQVAIDDGSTCFVSHRLVTPFDPAAPERAVVAIVESTARLTGRMPFGRMAAVHALFENRWQGITVEGSAEMELLALQVLDRTAGSINVWQDSVRPLPRPWRPSWDPLRAFRRMDIAAWVDRYEPRLFYFESSAHWGVARSTFWALHDKYRDDPLADRIAWTASQKDPPGECEGTLICELQYWLSSRFEYLRRHPEGAYVTETLEHLLDYLTYLNSWNRGTWHCEGRAREELTAEVEAIRTILGRVDHPLTRDVGAMIDSLAGPC